MNDMNNMTARHDPNHGDTSEKKNVPCGVIRDLLILYEDDVCSEESSKIIREHIKDCDGCRTAYEQAAKPFPAVTAGTEDEHKEDTRFIKTLQKYRKKITLLNILIVSFFLLVIAALVKIGWTEFLDSGIFAVPSEDVKVTELYQLEGGDIYCTLEFPKLITMPTLEPMEAIDRTSDKHEGYYEMHCQYPLSVNEEKYIYCDTMSVIFPAEASLYSYLTHDFDSAYTCISINYRGKNKKDRLVIWEEGQTLEKAPKQVEEKAIQAYQLDGNVPKALEEAKLLDEPFSESEIIQSFVDYYNNWYSPDCYPIYIPEPIHY